MAVFTVLLPATGLQLQISKVSVANYIGYFDCDLKRRLHERIGQAVVTVMRVARYIGPGAAGCVWEVALENCPRRCSLFPASATHLANEITKCDVYCLSVMMFLGQLFPPEPRMLRLAAAFFASMLSAPMHAVTPAALSSLTLVHAPVAVRTVPDAFRAASTRLALRTGLLDDIRGRIDQAADMDDALLLHRAPPWASHCLLTLILELRTRALALPPASLQHPRPEPLIHRDYKAAGDPGRLRDWLRRRLSHVFEYNVADGEVDLVTSMLDWVFCDLPCFLAFAAIRVIANYCPVVSCLFGCQAMGPDDLRHYLVCLRFAMVASQCGRRPPPWAVSSSLRAASLALPLNRSGVRSSCD